MTPEETSVLLAYAQTLDSRLRQTEEQAKYQISAWSKILDEVPPAFARSQVDRFYRAGTPQAALGPGDIRGAWRTAQRTEAAKDNSIGVLLPVAIPSRAPDWFRDMAMRCADGWKETRKLHGAAYMQAAAELNLRNVQVVHQYREPDFHELRRDERQRDCGTAGCPCPHQECRGGFRDAETQTGAVQRCDWCYEAVTMAQELSPKRRGHR